MPEKINLYSAQDLSALFMVRKVTIYRWGKTNRNGFPAPVISYKGGRSLWKASEIHKFLAEQIDEAATP